MLWRTTIAQRCDECLGGNLLCDALHVFESLAHDYV